MITSFQALGVALLVLLPGASYTFAFERLAGSFGVKTSDRLVRFLAASAVFQALYSGLTFELYRHVVLGHGLREGHLNSGLVELGALGYVLVPTVAGSLLGSGARDKRRWATWLTGGSPEPRAWDYVWGQPKKRALVRLRLKSGVWLGGFWTSSGGSPSYAAAYPEEGDLYLRLALLVDPASGAFLLDDAGKVQTDPGRSGLLLRWEEVEYATYQGMENSD